MSPVPLWGPVAGYALLIFVLSSIPDGPSLPGGIGDKGAHALVYSGLGFLLARAVTGGMERPVSVSAVLVSVSLAVVYGFSDEVHQLFVRGRHFDLRDLVADGVGAAAGAAALWLWGIISRFRDALR